MQYPGWCFTKLIKETEQPTGCQNCRHYVIRRESAFPHGCRAMVFIGKEPAENIVLNSDDPFCPLFEPVASPAS